MDISAGTLLTDVVAGDTLVSVDGREYRRHVAAVEADALVLTVPGSDDAYRLDPTDWGSVVVVVERAMALPDPPTPEVGEGLTDRAQTAMGNNPHYAGLLRDVAAGADVSGKGVPLAAIERSYGWVERTEDGWAVTEAGRLVLGGLDSGYFAVTE